MINIPNDFSNDPHFNLALEEYAFKYLDPKEDYLILWQNCPSVIVGRNQNTIEEINVDYIKKNNINVVRRLSGGGAVYHDLGNLNFTFIMPNTESSGPDFQRFTMPVIKALAKFGVKAELTGRNDITIDGKKFSGNAQYYYRGRVLHHGTIMFNSDLDVVQASLNVKADKIASKGVKSVRSRVTNVIDYMPNKITVQEFKEVLLDYLIEESGQIRKDYFIGPKDLQIINTMVKERYATWEWNYGHSPAFNLKKSQRFPGGSVELLLDVEKGLIKNCKIYGDFFHQEDVDGLEKLLVNQRYETEAIESVLKGIKLSDYLGTITKEEFLSCMF